MAQLAANTIYSRNVERQMLVRDITEAVIRGRRSFVEVEEGRRRTIREKSLVVGAIVTHEYDEAFRDTIKRITPDGKVYLKGRPNKHIHPAMLRRV